MFFIKTLKKEQKVNVIAAQAQNPAATACHIKKLNSILL